jgi:sugar phosphate isomerase/epimerase
MKLILFSKMLKDRSIDALADLAASLGIDGYDLAVRPGHPVNPDNVAEALPRAAATLRARGFDIPMITANTDLVDATAVGVDTLLAAMAAAEVPRVKLGYYKIDLSADYWAAVDACREKLASWGEKAKSHGVQVLYHTHSNRCMGLNAGMLAHLLRGLDPRGVGAYLDTGHLTGEGEEFAVALAMQKEHLSAVSLKDFLLQREVHNGHGRKARNVVEAGQGMTDFTAAFECLHGIGYTGPASIHCEFEVDAAGFEAAVEREAAFFVDLRRRVFGAES